jgi:putative nucleotidyltransferase with HDIG domain
MDIPKRILFVDDEPNVLSGLRRMLRANRREWDMKFAAGGAEALQILQTDAPPYDIILSDMRMPGIDGANLLRQVMHQYPHMVRIVLSGQADREDILQAVGPIHQYLSKPCEADTLKSTLSRTLALDNLLSDTRLKQLLSSLETLPSQPALYNAVVDELQTAAPSAETLARLISQDIGMSAKTLQLVNSAFFGLARHVPGPGQAVSMLGIDTLKALGLSTKIFIKIEPHLLETSHLAALWPHSMRVSACAKAIAVAENAPQQIVDYAFIAGLLHDVGKLALSSVLPDEYNAVLSATAHNGEILLQAEHQTFGTTHAEVGAYLLGLWGLPTPVVNALAYHHAPTRHQNNSFDAVTAVHAANALISGATINEPYLQRLNLIQRLPQWQALCESIIQQDGIYE